MKSKDRFVPYENAYETLKKWRAIGSVLLYFVSAFSVLIPLMPRLYQGTAPLYDFMQYINYLLIIAYYVVSIVTDIFLYPGTARLRRLGFIDNSLGSKFLGNDTRNYFTNDGLEPGIYKMAVNCFESCYFTYNIAKGMHPTVITKNVLFSIIFLSTAYVGIKDNLVGLPILQILLSSLFLTQLIHHLNFVSKLGILLEKFKSYFMAPTKAAQEDVHDPILLVLEYETVLAYNRSHLSDRVYGRLKRALSTEWEDLKHYYRIVQ